VLLFGYYFANYFFIVYFNSSLVACAIFRFLGLSPSLASGLRALKRSAEIIKKSWGESLVSNLGIGLVTTLVTMLLIVTTAVFTIMLAVKFGSIAVALAGVALILVIIVLAALVSSALSSIALCASYLYATEGKVPRAFADAGLQHAFAARA